MIEVTREFLELDDGEEHSRRHAAIGAARRLRPVMKRVVRQVLAERGEVGVNG